MQGRYDSPLSARGCEQARLLGGWLSAIGFAWDAAYCSPLQRASHTARIVAEAAGGVSPVLEPLLTEIAAGRLEGLDHDAIHLGWPAFAARGVTELGDFAEFGGESYAEVQARVAELRARIEARHRAAKARVLLVAHGGFNFQLVKHLVCAPVPRVCILTMGNCAATLVRLRERRGTYMGEVAWHVPLELMGGRSHDATAALFR